jgi:hypothetical protein
VTSPSSIGRESKRRLAHRFDVSAGSQPRDAFAEAVARLLVLQELKKTGTLTYEEFAILKARLLSF